MASIIELIKNIRNARLGKDVRESIASAIEQTYEDATEKGSSNMEVAQARGIFDTLNQRLNNSDSLKADQTALQSETTARQTADSDLQTQINAVASGSPAGVYATVTALTTADPDHSKIYVVTADGHWYYYDGNEWTDGGVYQAIELSNRSVNISNLDENLQKTFDNIYENNAYDRTQGYLNNSHNIDTTLYSHYEINVNAGEIVLFNVYYGKTNYPVNSILYCIKDSLGNILKEELSTSGMQNESRQQRLICIPQNGSKLYINTATNMNNQANASYVLKIEKHMISEPVKYNNLEENLQNLLKKNYTDITESLETLLSNYFIADNGALYNNNGYDLLQLEVLPGEVYKISNYQFYSNPVVGLTSKDNEKQITINNSTITFNELFEPLTDSNIQTGYVTLDFTVPPYCNKIYINKDKTKSLKISKVISYEIEEKDKLANKTILFTGDSICYGAGNRDVSGLLTQHADMQYVAGSGITAYNNTAWAQYIAEKHLQSSVYGYGVSGTCITRQSSQIETDGYDSSILERISVMKDDADYVILHGGINDQGRMLPLGTVRNNGNSLDYTTDSQYYDTYTFAGAVEWAIIQSKTKWKNAKIGFILTPKVLGREHNNYIVNNVNYKQESYMNIIKQACAKWGIPILSLYEEVSSYFNATDSDYWDNGDGLHPTKLCYDNWISPRIDAWIQSL